MLGRFCGATPSSTLGAANSSNVTLTNGWDTKQKDSVLKEFITYVYVSEYTKEKAELFFYFSNGLFYLLDSMVKPDNMTHWRHTFMENPSDLS